MSNNTLAENGNQKLDATGMKNTSQRTILLEIIRQGHLGADEIYELARKKQPRLSLSTVYRTLRRLKELGLIEELHFAESHHHYEMKTSPESCHLLCLGCGLVTELDYRLGSRMKRNIAWEKGFTVTGAEIEIVGYCDKCREVNQ